MGAQKIFGTDGVRGRSNFHPMDSEMALALGRAAAFCLKNGKHRHRIVIGKDTRLSGYMLETALASGIVSMGTDVMLVGPLPTPGVAFISRSMRADTGVVISGSHNDWRDNGIKFFDKSGFKLSDAVEARMEAAILSGETDGSKVPAEKLGKAYRIEDAAGRYIQFLKSCFPAEKTLDGLKIVVDCSNGAGYQVAPHVLEELGADCLPIANEPDGMNINLNCGSLHTEGLCRKVKEAGADCGIALDGDADRVIMCDETGAVVDGDVILALCGKHWQERKRLKRSVIVATVMSNLALDHVMRAQGIQVVRTPVGDRYVVETMRREGYNVGGEQSGHLIFLDHNSTGDGILGALQVLAIMLEENRPLSELKKILEPFPQVLLNVPVREKRDFSKVPSVVEAIQYAEKSLGADGRVLVRYSGTEKIARIMVEGKEESKIRGLAETVRDVIQEKLGEA
ncbi:MAG: phosphoglucosamine mutase [Deltaproteobacteria bacterium]|nr:phosphoglucosamine mutase [Deltaproteobacteria bacterium]